MQQTHPFSSTLLPSCHLLSNRLVSTSGAAVSTVSSRVWVGKPRAFSVGSLHFLPLFHLSYSAQSSNQQLKTERRCEFVLEWWFVPNIIPVMSWQLIWCVPCLLLQGWDSPPYPPTATPWRSRDNGWNRLRALRSVMFFLFEKRTLQQVEIYLTSADMSLDQFCSPRQIHVQPHL